MLTMMTTTEGRTAAHRLGDCSMSLGRAWETKGDQKRAGLHFMEANAFYAECGCQAMADVAADCFDRVSIRSIRHGG